MKTSLFLFLLCAVWVSGSAQTLNEVIQHVRTAKNLSYVEFQLSKDIFSDNLYHDTIYARFDFASIDTIIKIRGGEREVWRDSRKIIDIDYTDNTYKIKEPQDFSGLIHNSLPSTLSRLGEKLPANNKISPLKDTIFQGVLCDYYRFTAFDSIKNGRRVYDTRCFFVNKETQLPVYYRLDSEGFLNDNVTHVTIFQESIFDHIEINAKQLPDISDMSIPSKYALYEPKEELPLLQPQVPSPPLAFLDVNGRESSIEDLKGEIVLLNISWVGCPHCVQSIPMLNRLKKKYEEAGLTILSLYPLDKDEDVMKMHRQFGTTYTYNRKAPTTLKSIEEFHVTGYPTFYIVDDDSKVIKGWTGYSKNIDDEIEQLIRDQLAQ